MFKHGLDHVLIRENQLFAYGWGFSPGQVVSKLVLRLHFKTTSTYLEIEANYGQRRDDVQKVFPLIPEAVDAGYLILADIGEKKISHAELFWEIKGQKTIKTSLGMGQFHRQEQAVSRMFHYFLLAKKSVSLLRNAGPHALIKKVLRYRVRKPIEGSSHAMTELTETLRSQPFSIVIDHDIGGGANTYRNEYIQQQVTKGENVLLLGFHVASLQYFVEFYQNQRSVRYSLKSIEAFLLLVGNANIQHILYNCAVTFRQPLHVIEMLITLRKHVHCNLIVTIHDYFAVCPSHFLLDHTGVFCDVPELSTCQRCLAVHNDSFVSFSGTRDIVQWRETWARLLIAADEVRLFSKAAAQILRRAYPQLDDSKWRVVPHTLHTEMSKVELRNGEYLHIGVVGVVGTHKGAKIISALTQEIVRRQSNAKITIIGSIEARVPANIVDITGAYEAENLSTLVKNSGANLFLFPSIWAETFSYVAHELVEMGVPFACFDLGAPADLARSYQQGLVLSSMQPRQILDELENYFLQNIKTKKAVVWMNTAA
jgi:glycosyltransferase involved in cell wall biosynthesis